jgi:hypothetical protein
MLEAGQVLHDNDPRYRGRKVEVLRIVKGHTPSANPDRGK